MTCWTTRSNLRGVVVYGVGTEKVDLNAAKERGVVVAHTPDAFTSEVAEHAIALLLALARCVTDSDADVRQRHLWRTYDDTFRPRRLRGSTLGVLGYGRIGRATATLAGGFGMRLVVFDPFIPAERLTPPSGADMCVASDLDDLLGLVDALTVHVPLTDDTRGMLGAPQFARIRRGDAADQRVARRHRGSLRPATGASFRRPRRGRSGRVRDRAAKLRPSPPSRAQPHRHPSHCLEVGIRGHGLRTCGGGGGASYPSLAMSPNIG